MVRGLASTAQGIERLFGSPQDIEFAFADGRLHILQSRPISALPEPRLPYPIIWGNRTNRELLGRATVFWSNWNTRENMPYPLKPMSWSFLNDLLFPAIFRVMFGTRPDSPLYRHSFVIDLVNGRAYWNMNRLYGHPFFGAMLGPIIKHIDNEAGSLFNGLLRGGRLVPQKPRISSLRLAWEWLVALKTWAGFPWFTGIGAIETKCRAYWRRADGYNSFPLEGLSNLELLRRAREFGYETARTAFPLLMVAGKALWGMLIIEKLTRRWKDLNLDLLLAGIPGNKTTEGALELFGLSEMPPEVREVFVRWPGKDFRALEEELGDGAPGRQFLGRVASFLDRHGHRGLKDLDFGYPSWGEDRTYVYQMIKSYLDYGPGEKDPIAQYEESKQRRLALTAEIERRLSTLFTGPLRVRLFRFGLKLAQDHFPLRENEKYYGLRCFPGSRRIVLEIGRRYREAGLLEDAADIFFLTVPEVEEMELSTAESAKDVRDKVKERKLEWKAQIDARPPFVVRSDGLETEPAEEREAEPGVLRGVPASPGVVKGKARIIREPSEAHRLRKGEILVAPYTEPGWAPLFLLARALVMEVGGAVCHGAIVAREYGIPAVVGARGAMSSIKDGQEIMVDGSSGEVRLDPEVSRIVLKGKRVVLRPPSLEDLPYIRSLWADPETMKDVGGVVPRTEEQMEAWFRRMVDPGSDTDSYFLIVPKNSAPVGEASFHRYDPRTRKAELNVKVQAGHRGQGYGPEAVRLLLGHFFGEFGGEVMLDPVAAGNTGGQRMLERLGFRRTGTAAGAVVLLMDKESFYATGRKREG
jgi:pyruvate,water dikinase